ncbi:MAG: hypothetical protein AVDCRST_MAG50-2949 [uncultured Acidimicrobiales bacterium]|uniref:Major facilitator superfamily (MFS) profile domain-containing protein n=1 Tax=uncultured Acidimicrobiales bacterium TaxID=310071 RepID=A0A6J4IU36_9ACTN|nr:MAG: hypothetical protein AVDCRST_MAG50-2949 [uncultured Acidimicrobiales bacterium]
MTPDARHSRRPPLPAVAVSFLRWAWMRAALARGWWLVTSVYLVVVADLTALELVLLGTFQGVTVVLAEVPAGVLADTVSRKWTLVAAHVVMGSGMALTGLVTAFPVLVLTQALWGLGWALSSGADVAWVTDELDRPDLINRVLAKRARREVVGAAAGIVGIGALAWAGDLATAVVVAGLAMVLLGLVEVARFPEHRFVATPSGRRQEAWVILRRGVALARGDHVVLIVLAATLLINGGGEAFGRLLQRRLLDLSFPVAPDPIVWFAALALSTLAVAAVVLRMVEARIDGTGVARRAYAGAALVGSVGLFLFAHAPDARTAVAGVLVVEGVALPVTRAVGVIWVNQRATSQVRATVHSFLSQAENLGEILLGVTLGVLAGAASITVALTGSVVLFAAAAAIAMRAVSRAGEPV